MEVKREVTCRLMYAVFPLACSYTREVSKWMGQGEQYLSLMLILQDVQPVPGDGSEKWEDNDGITGIYSKHDRG
jgi:hypothetical protein